MKKFLIAAACVFAAIMWQPAPITQGQQKTQNPAVQKEQQKLGLFQAVDKAQDSTLQLLKRSMQKPAPKRKERPQARPMDTLLVRGTTIITPVDSLYEDLYYLIPDTTVKKKRKSLWQRIFGK